MDSRCLRQYCHDSRASSRTTLERKEGFTQRLIGIGDSCSVFCIVELCREGWSRVVRPAVGLFLKAWLELSFDPPFTIG